MAWRKRRRYRLASIVSYFCAFFGVVFIVGNVIMLREGFVQLYSSTFGDRRPYSLDDRKSAARLSRHGTRLSLHGWAEVDNNDNFRLLDIPPIELPSAALKAELRLRKLMENKNSLAYMSESRQRLDEEIKYLQRIVSTTSGRASPRGTASMTLMTSLDLRRSLWETSDCAGLRNKSGLPVIGSGWTKVVYRTRYHNQDVALKMVDPASHDVMSCLSEHSEWTKDQCYEQSALKLLKEMVLLRGLQNPHIVQVIAHCVTEQPYVGNHDSMVSMATELGEGVDIISLLHMSWEDRLRISYGLCKMLFYLAHSPYGSVVLNDFRRQQFVLVSGDLKLTDLDDMGFLEPPCLLDCDCRQHYSSTNVTLTAKCINSRCLGLNEKKNIFNAARHFATFLLPHGAPRSLRHAVDDLVEHFSIASRDSRGLLEEITGVLEDYSSGKYLQGTDRQHTRYRQFTDSDLPGQYDYSCRYAMMGAGCVVSVYDQKEAEELCDAEEECRGFVLTGKRTWTGRILAHFKNGIGPRIKTQHASVFIKPMS